MARQRLRLVQVRKPGTFDDLKTPAEILDAETTPEDEDEFLDYVLSQIRQILGQPDWKLPPGASLATLASRKFDVDLLGAKDGSNLVFTTPNKFLENSLVLHYNGVRQKRGSGCDYTVSESGGIGTGYDTITLEAGLAPVAVDVLTADYTIDLDA